MVRKTTSIRKFNGKYYVRSLATRNELIANTTKDNFRRKGNHALIIKYYKKEIGATIYQVWVRRKK